MPKHYRGAIAMIPSENHAMWHRYVREAQVFGYYWAVAKRFRMPNQLFFPGGPDVQVPDA
jgi:hypothetical protein